MENKKNSLDSNNDINLLIYIIYHDDVSYEHIKKYNDYHYVKLIRIVTTKYFESIIFRYLNENKDEWINRKYIGILTYSFEKKLSITLDDIYKTIKDIYYKWDFHLITLFNSSRMSRSFHGNIKKILDYTLSLFGCILPIPYYKIPFFCCNYWITTPYWMQLYIAFTLKFIDKLEKIPYLKILANSDARYKNGKLEPQQLMKLIGYPYYTHHSFVLERLPSIFFWYHGFKDLEITSDINIKVYKYYGKINKTC